MKPFSEFNLAPDVVEALAGAGIETPTPIQAGCIPLILEGKDVVGKAETGTGKTIGFGAPLVGTIDCQRVAVQGMVLAPTRELAQQVAGVFEQLGSGRKLGVALLVGGVHASEQVLKLRSGSQVVVGTPGRVLEFVRDRILQLAYCEWLVLDEADRMLDMGFIDDVGAIIEKTPQERQTLLFSATLPAEIEKLLNKYMKNPETISTSSGLATVPDISQLFVEADFHQKFKELCKLLDDRGEQTIVVFCNTRRQAIDLDRMLWGHGYSAAALHGDQEQDARFKILESFRRGDIKVLVATDVASRGLDIDDIGCVVNYEIPGDSESYVHRIGRTGRAQKTGEAISIVSSKEWESWQRIVRETNFTIDRSGPERISKRGPGARGRGRGERGPRSAGDESRGRGGRGRGERTRGGRSGGPRGGASEASGGRRRPPRREGGDAKREREPVGARKAEAPKTEAPKTEAPKTEAPKTEAPKTEAPKTEAPKTGAETSSFGSGLDSRPAARRTGSAGGKAGSSAGSSAGSKADGAIPASFSSTPTPPPKRKKLDEIDDDFLKVDYFDVDDSLIRRGGPARPAEVKTEKSGPKRSGGGGAEESSDRKGPRRRRRGGRGRRRGGQQGESGAGTGRADGGAPSGGAPSGGAPQSEGSSAGSSDEKQSTDARPGSSSKPQRRRRRRPRGPRKRTTESSEAAEKSTPVPSDES